MKLSKKLLTKLIKEELESELLGKGYSYASPRDEEYAQGYKDGYDGREFDDLVGGEDYERGYEEGTREREESDIRNSKNATAHMDYVFYKNGEIAFYLIDVPSDMREGDSLNDKVVSQLPAHDKYKVFGPSPAVMTKADTRRDGASDRIISADTLALGDRPDYHSR